MNDSKTQHLKLALVVFNLVLIAYQLLFNFGESFAWSKVLLGGGVATLVAALVFGLLSLLKK